MEGILERLKLQLEPSTKEETLRAMCLLAGSNTHSVVPTLLNKPLPWDRYLSRCPGARSPSQSTFPCSNPAHDKNHCARMRSPRCQSHFMFSGQFLLHLTPSRT